MGSRAHGICPGAPCQRSPNAPKFEDRSQEETEWQEQGAREAAWKLQKTVFTLISLKTEIARSVKGPKLQGPHAEDGKARADNFGDLITADHKS